MPGRRRCVSRIAHDGGSRADIQSHRHRQGRSRSDRRAQGFRREGSDGRRRHRPRRIFHHQLQGRSRHLRQGAGGAALSDDRGRRFCGHRRTILASVLEAGRRGHLQRLGPGRDPSWRLCAEGAGEGRLAGAAAGGHERARGDGDRDRGLYRDAQRDGAGECRRHARQGPGDRDRCRGRRRLGRGRAAGEARLHGRGLDRPAAGGGLSEGPRRLRDHRPQGT